MKNLRLCLYALAEEDNRLIRNLMRMFSHDPAFRWELTEDLEHDVLVVSGNRFEDTKIKRSSARTILRLSDTPEPGNDNVLTRPLQAGAFRNWLQEAEKALTQPHNPMRETAMSTQSPSTLSGSEPRTSSPPSPRPARAVRLTPEHKAIRFKLRSWPPAIMIHNDPAREQMAQLLSVDAFEVNELAQITGAPLADCQAFVRKLQLVGLLDLIQPTSKSKAPPTMPQEEGGDDFSPSMIAGSVDKSGFSATITRWRDRLGI